MSLEGNVNNKIELTYFMVNRILSKEEKFDKKLIKNLTGYDIFKEIEKYDRKDIFKNCFMPIFPYFYNIEQNGIFIEKLL